MPHRRHRLHILYRPHPIHASSIGQTLHGRPCTQTTPRYHPTLDRRLRTQQTCTTLAFLSQMGGAGVALIQTVPLKPSLPGVVICVSIIGAIQNLFSAATRSVPSQGRVASRHAKIEIGTNQRYCSLIRITRPFLLTSRLKHKPGVPCTHDGCERIFSRVDNMKDHVRRIHRKAS